MSTYTFLQRKITLLYTCTQSPSISKHLSVVNSNLVASHHFPYSFQTIIHMSSSGSPASGASSSWFTSSKQPTTSTRLFFSLILVPPFLQKTLSHIGTPYHVEISSDHQFVEILENLAKPDKTALSAGSTPTICTLAFLLLRYRPVPVTVPPVPMPATNMSTSPEVASHISGPAGRNSYPHHCLIFSIKLKI